MQAMPHKYRGFAAVYSERQLEENRCVCSGNQPNGRRGSAHTRLPKHRDELVLHQSKRLVNK